jgi:benzoyl-CoA reductase/2-hydroxyglutaryl-CoA dehydratase subunit BcrC/BadD/HgdB
MTTETQKSFKVSDVAKRGYSEVKKYLYEKANEDAQEGKPVAWCCPTVIYGNYHMILSAMDIVPMAMDHFGAICAVKGVASYFLDACAKDYISDSLCGYMRCVYGHAMLAKQMGKMPPEAPLGGWPKPALMVGRPTYCDGTIKVFQTLARHYDVPVYHCDMYPAVYHEDTEAYRERLIMYQYSELKDFADFAQRVTGRKVDWDKLSEMVYRQEEIHRLWREIDEMRKNIPCPISNLDLWAVIAPGFWLPGREETLKFFHDLHAEVSKRVADKAGVIPNEKYRLMWMELPPWHGLDMFEYFMQKEAVFAIESFWYSQFMIPVEKPDNVTDPLMRLAYEVPTFSSKLMKMAKGDAEAWRTQFYLMLARDWKIDGVVSHPLLSCRAPSFSQRHAEDILLNKYKIPSIRIQGDIVDKRAMLPFEQLKPQIDAFIETVANYKEIRRQEGLM